MINKLRRRLILIYTGSTGIILTIVFILILVITNQQLKKNQKETFQNNFMTVSQKILMNNEISNLWLAEMETKNRLVIHIEDCGQALRYKGSQPAATNRGILVENVKKLAEKDSINTDIRPASVSEIHSRIYQVGGIKNEKYLGEVMIAPVDNGYRSVIMLQYISDHSSAAIRQKLLMAALYLSGIAAFYFISWWLVGKSLQPVEESRKRQTEFIASASHELKSPLAVIRADASAVKIEPNRAEHFIDGIDRECMRLSSLIEDLLLLASTDAKKWNMKKELIDMDLLLVEIYDTFQPFCKKHQKELKLKLQEDMLPRVEGDGLRIRQILSVLIDNAVSYSKDEDTIILCAYRKKNQLMIEVEDHGAGIEQNKKQDIFERFYKGDKSRKDKNHFGLGLSIAKELTEMHGGSISVKDTQGGGATFIVSLPIHDK